MLKSACVCCLLLVPKVIAAKPGDHKQTAAREKVKLLELKNMDIAAEELRNFENNLAGGEKYSTTSDLFDEYSEELGKRTVETQLQAVVKTLGKPVKMGTTNGDPRWRYVKSFIHLGIKKT